ncbi:MAG: hypothetical protein ACPGQD_00560 [Planctomycetota bacterium]
MRQEGPPELPGAIEFVGEDLARWSLALAGLFLFVRAILPHVVAWRRSQAARREAEAPPAASRSPWEELQQALGEPSAQAEIAAEALAHYLRVVAGTRRGTDCLSWTAADFRRRDREPDEELLALLAFSDEVLYAGVRPTASAWQQVLARTAAWNGEDVA